ncbi:MAG TPA: hypothetical protein DCW68_03285 [Rhodospirillaceae bacterium]|nr:hypothetical protein [Rhodospirillaceae bacterium]
MTNRLMTSASVFALTMGLVFHPVMAQTVVGTPGGTSPGMAVEVNLDILEPNQHAVSLPPVVLTPPPALNMAPKTTLSPPVIQAPAPAAEKKTEIPAAPSAAPLVSAKTVLPPVKPQAPEAASEKKPETAQKPIVAATKPTATKSMPKRLPGTGSGHQTSTPTPPSKPEKTAKPESEAWPMGRKTAIDGAIEAEALRDALAKAREQMGDNKSLPPAAALTPSPNTPRGEPKPNAIDGALKAAVLREATEKAAEIRGGRNKTEETPVTTMASASTTVAPPSATSDPTPAATANTTAPTSKPVVQEQKPQAPVAAVMAKPENLRLTFEGTTSDIKSEYPPKIDAIIGWLQKNETARLQIEAYASSPDGQTNMARRISLSRALAIRSYLIDHSIRSTRIDVRAKGDATTEEPLDRVDLIITE